MLLTISYNFPSTPHLSVMGGISVSNTRNHAGLSFNIQRGMPAVITVTIPGTISWDSIYGFTNKSL